MDQSNAPLAKVIGGEWNGRTVFVPNWCKYLWYQVCWSNGEQRSISMEWLERL